MGENKRGGTVDAKKASIASDNDRRKKETSEQKIFDQKVFSALERLGMFVSPFDVLEHELELLLNACRGRSYQQIFLYLFRYGPRRFSDIKRNTTVSETQVVKSLKKMVEKEVLRKDGRHYDIGLRGLRWARDKKAKPSILLTVG